MDDQILNTDTSVDTGESKEQSISGFNLETPISEIRDLLPEDIRESTSFSKLNSVGDVFKSYHHSEKKFGSKIDVPNLDSTDDDYEKFYSKTRPTDIKEYSFVKNHIDKVDDVGKQVINKISESFFKNGLLDKQSEAIFKDLPEIISSADKARMDIHSEEFNSLAEKLFETPEKMGMALKNVDSILQKFGNDDLLPKDNTSTDPRTFLYITDVINKIYNEYVSEDNTSLKTDFLQNDQSHDKESLRSELAEVSNRIRKQLPNDFDPNQVKDRKRYKEILNLLKSS